MNGEYELPGWVSQVIGLAVSTGLGAGTVRLWDWWTRQNDQARIDKGKETDSFNAWLIGRLEKVEKLVDECHVKHTLEAKERQEALIGLTRQLAEAQTRLEVLSSAQNRIQEKQTEIYQRGLFESFKQIPDSNK